MASGEGRVVSKIPIAVWSCAPGFSDASSRSPLPFPLVFFLLLFSYPPARPTSDSVPSRRTPAPSRAAPPVRLHSAGSHPVLPGRAQIYSVDSATAAGGIAVLYTRRESIDSRARIWKHYIFPRRTSMSFSRKPCCQ